MEARGFILAAPVALSLGVGFVPVRKPGKLPWKTRAVSYDLEYGSETLEMHVDALDAGDRVLVVDDVLATGGTARATAELVEQGGGIGARPGDAAGAELPARPRDDRRPAAHRAAHRLTANRPPLPAAPRLATLSVEGRDGWPKTGW